MARVVVVGAGVGGLVTGAMLARAGQDVTVLEAHIYPGGCAGTFYHQGYRFDAGATLPAGFEPGGVMQRLGATLGIDWAARLAREAMVVHLADGTAITQWTDQAAWQATRAAAFGRAGERFWRWQEQTANALWEMAYQSVPWPPANAAEFIALAGNGWRVAARRPGQLPGLAADALHSVAAHLPTNVPALRQFVDAQLLISAQATANHANALYGAAALDLPRRGVAHLVGGMGSISRHLADALGRQGGQIHYRQRVTRVTREPAGSWRVETNKGLAFTADTVIFNLSSWDAQGLLNADPAPRLEAHGSTTEVVTPNRQTQGVPADGWGAFIVYAGLDERTVPAELSLHHQVVMDEPLGEGNSVFLSLSLPGDITRAPDGRRALTMSTHTALQPWWDLFERDRPAYEARKVAWTERVWAAVERVLPGARGAADLALPGTPITFERFTHRSLGWVGGFPQTSLTRARRPKLGEGLWLVGDSIFPGQSTLAVTLGALRVVDAVVAGLTQADRGRRTRWARTPHQLEDCGS
jgi:C-3',4' desaturase CrtD